VSPSRGTRARPVAHIGEMFAAAPHTAQHGAAAPAAAPHGAHEEADLPRVATSLYETRGDTAMPLDAHNRFDFVAQNYYRRRWQSINDAMRSNVGVVVMDSVSVADVATTLIVYLLLSAVAAKYYIGQREAAFSLPLTEASPDDFKDFRSSALCDCLDRPGICLWSCLCPCVRWADNMWTMGILSGFWLPMLAFCLLGTVIHFSVCVLVPFALLAAMYRQGFRRKFGMTRIGGSSILTDFCLYCCCMPCAVAQESRQVEEAVRASHPAVVRNAAAVP